MDAFWTTISPHTKFPAFSSLGDYDVLTLRRTTLCMMFIVCCCCCRCKTLPQRISVVQYYGTTCTGTCTSTLVAALVQPVLPRDCTTGSIPTTHRSPVKHLDSLSLIQMPFIAYLLRRKLNSSAAKSIGTIAQ
jgi:hypothetical protein